MLQAETVLNNRYRIVGPIGEGGMATVYEAVDTRLGRTVAIKVLHPEFSRDQPFLERFQQEAEFAASLGAHPNIVAIYDIGEDGDLRYLVMERVDGRSLKDIIRERAPFSVEEAFGIGAQVASALEFAHNRGLVHRDVKPQNILVTPAGIGKVTDFGIARSASASQLTRTGTVLGTVHYFSPEQAQGKQAAPTSDIYSLGIILYEMLTGHLPFDAENPIGVAMQHLHSEPPSPWQYNPGLSPQAVAIVMRALEKDPEKRYRDAGELAAALKETPQPTMGMTVVSPIVEPERQRTAVYRAVEPGGSVPPPPTARVTSAVPSPRELPTRNRLQLPALILLALLLIAGLTAAAFFLTGSFAGGGSATRTLTPTPKPTARPHKKPTSTSLVVVPPAPTNTVVPAATATRVPPTATPSPPPATNTPVPPTSTPPAVIIPIGPTATSTNTG